MSYLAININYIMDMDWYHKCSTILECYQYFDRLGPGDGERIAIYDLIAKEYLWIVEDSQKDIDRIDAIVFGAQQKIKKNR